MKQKMPKATPRLLQLLFIIGIVAMYVSQTIFTVMTYFQGASTNVSQDYALLNVVSVGMALIPLVVATLIQLSRRDRALSVRSAFETLVLTATAMLLMVTLGYVTSLFNFYPFAFSGIGNLWWFTFITTGLPLVLIVCGLVVTILHLRRQKQW